MRYSYEYKRKCVEMYREGRWPETPTGIKDTKNFREMIRRWVLAEEANGPEILKHQGTNKEWTPEEKYELVAKVIAGASNQSVAIDAGINSGLLYQWVRKYRLEGYNGLVSMRKGRPPKEPQMKKINYNNPRKLNESEYEELVRLRAENAYIKAEIEVIKKEIALREEKEAARLKAKKQRSSKNSKEKDTN
jgi:transposase-like protein